LLDLRPSATGDTVELAFFSSETTPNAVNGFAAARQSLAIAMAAWRWLLNKYEPNPGRAFRHNVYPVKLQLNNVCEDAAAAVGVAKGPRENTAKSLR
jgi:hypothetical protein